MKLTKTPFEKIESGQKIIESRLFDEKRRQINVGDRIEFIQTDNSDKKVVTKVTALYRYPLFSDLFSDFSPKYFGGESKEDLLQEIRQFYSLEAESKFGVVGIKIEKE
ncbi:MAG TPA: ASCH domain-containing protein [Candidatus Paceibacterota bacterium]